MKTLFTFFITGLFFTAIAQNDLTLHQKVQLNTNTYFQFENGTNPNHFNVLPASTHYFVVDTVTKNGDKFYVIEPVQFKHAPKDKSEPSLAKSVNGARLLVRKTVLEKNTVQPEKIERFSVGLLTLPFKARPQKEFAFDTEFNLNSSLNVFLTEVAGTTEWYWQLGAGIGNVGINNENTDAAEKIESTNVATFTALTGLMLQYNRVQAGIYVGWDFINNQSYYQWNHQAKPWIGFGVGYQLFKFDLGDKPASKITNKRTKF